jgi:hypothetical protein
METLRFAPLPADIHLAASRQAASAIPEYSGLELRPEDSVSEDWMYQGLTEEALRRWKSIAEHGRFPKAREAARQFLKNYERYTSKHT